jgi:hypothetical protein
MLPGIIQTQQAGHYDTYVALAWDMIPSHTIGGLSKIVVSGIIQ